MGKFITKFNTTAAFEAAEATLAQPNVSLIKENMGVYYKPLETRVVAKFNVTTNTKTQMILGYRQTGATSSAVTTAFTSVYVDGNEIEISDANVNYTFDTVGEHTVKYELKDPTTINLTAFNGQLNGYKGVNAVSIIIPNSVTSIGSQAFMLCSGLTSIVIPDSVTSIGTSAFYGCSGLTSCTIGSGVTSIGTSAFSGCTSLSSCTFDNSSQLTNIGNYAFKGCTNLTSIDIPSGVTSLSDGVLSDCKSLTSATIGSGVTSIGSGAFYDCTKLTSIEIPSGVTSIGESAFQDCNSLTSCTIGSGVRSIGYSAFKSCSSLSTITSHIMSAPSVNAGTFANVKTGGTLYVPQGSSGYETWMDTQGNLGYYNWTKVEQ